MSLQGRWALRPVAGSREELCLVETESMRSVLRLDPTSSADDTAIETCVAGARSLLERRYRHVFGQQQYDLVLDAAPCEGRLRIPISPLLSIQSVTFYDTDDIATTWTQGVEFEVDTLSMPGRLLLKSGVSWPSNLREAEAIVVRLTAGYDDTEDVPEVVVPAIQQVAAFLFEHRGEGSSEFTLPPVVEDLMADLDRPEA